MGTKIVGVAGPKGGVGKTTLALNLATYASRFRGLSVLLIDADPIRSAVDAATAAGDAMPFDIAATDDPDQLTRLRSSPHGLVVVDLPGTDGDPLAALLGARIEGKPDRTARHVDALILPTRPELMDLRPLLRTIDEHIIGSGVPYLIALVRVHRNRVAAAAERREELRAMGYPVANTLSRMLVAHDDAVEAHRPLCDLPGGAHSLVRAADNEYRALSAQALATAGLPTDDLTDKELS